MNHVRFFRVEHKAIYFGAIFPMLRPFFPYYQKADNLLVANIEKCVINSDSRKLSIMIKDLLENAFKSTNTLKPQVRIAGRVIGEKYLITIENNQWPSKSTLDQMIKNNFPPTKIGWRTVRRFAKDLQVGVEIPNLDSAPNYEDTITHSCPKRFKTTLKSSEYFQCGQILAALC